MPFIPRKFGRTGLSTFLKFAVLICKFTQLHQQTIREALPAEAVTLFNGWVEYCPNLETLVSLVDYKRK